MAGIGFELRKIFKEESLSAMAKGAAYSTVVTIGPTIIIISTLILLYIALGFFSIEFDQRELLSSTILYAFIFSVICTSPFNAVASRYIADKIYFEQIDDVLPSFYSGLASSLVLGCAMAIPFLLRVWQVGGVAPWFVWCSFGLFVSLIIVLYAANYLVATKEYKMITLYYVLGMVLAAALALAFHYWAGQSAIESILYGLTIGFQLVAFLLFSYIRKYFSGNSRAYGAFFRYCGRFMPVFLTNLFYTLGLYVHNFVFWSLPNHMVVAQSYVSSMAYDMASCLAMFSNISMIVLFTVMAETKFHEIYQQYNESVIGATYGKIRLNRKRMFRLLSQQLFYLAMVQALISFILFLIAYAALPRLGFSGMTISIYPLLSGTYFAIFSTYCCIIFLFYFDDRWGALCTALILFAGNLVGALLSCRLSPEFYGVGPLAGSLLAWSFGYFRIRYMERHFDRHIFCHVRVVEQLAQPQPDNIVYRQPTEQPHG
ncbi:MAG: exopolysaccharide Pel transporter PelG [Christensenellales bacterium]|jgi:uncharacterized membrane protein